MQSFGLRLFVSYLHTCCCEVILPEEKWHERVGLHTWLSFVIVTNMLRFTMIFPEEHSERCDAHPILPTTHHSMCIQSIVRLYINIPSITHDLLPWVPIDNCLHSFCASMLSSVLGSCYLDNYSSPVLYVDIVTIVLYSMYD